MKKTNNSKVRLVSYFSPKAFFSCLLLVIVVGVVMAYTKPVQAQTHIMSVYECHLSAQRTFSCRDANVPAYSRKAITNKDGRRVVVNSPNLMRIYCSQGICMDTRTKEYAGSYKNNESFWAVIPTGYYLHGDSQYIVRAHANGTGPEY